LKYWQCKRNIRGPKQFSAKVSNFEQTRAAQEVFICATRFKDRNSAIVWGSSKSKEVKTDNSGFTLLQLG
jgi:hypothetical protein